MNNLYNRFREVAGKFKVKDLAIGAFILALLILGLTMSSGRSMRRTGRKMSITPPLISAPSGNSPARNMKHLRKPDIWMENMFGTRGSSGASPAKIRRD